MNSFITLLDSAAPITAGSVCRALAGVGFLKHQFAWFVNSGAKDARTLASYCGVKKSTPARTARLDACLNALATLTPSQRAILPQKAWDSADVAALATIP